jgi:hypothetical protein
MSVTTLRRTVRTLAVAALLAGAAACGATTQTPGGGADAGAPALNQREHEAHRDLVNMQVRRDWLLGVKPGEHLGRRSAAR